MRYIPLAKVRAAAPPAWVTNSVAWKKRVDQAADKSVAITAIGNKWADLKQDFINIFGDKCWYTESPRIGTDNDVDHFRPKGGAKMKNGKTAERSLAGVTQDHKGYWWLAYDVTNYRYSCVFANRLRAGGGKGEYFPLEDETTRAWVPADALANEDVTLIDPCNQADVELVKFDHTPGEAVSKYDRASNPVAFERFSQSKKYYNLNEETITKARLAVITSVKKDLELLENCWGLPDEYRRKLLGAISTAEQSVVDACDRKAPFSAAVISLVKVKQAEPWLVHLIPRLDLTP